MFACAVGWLWLTAALAGCEQPVGLTVGPDPEDLLASPGGLAWSGGRDAVDLLIVMDNSGSMSQEQAAFAASFPLVLEGLFDPPDADGDGRPDYRPITSLHVGVVSTDMGTGGYRISTCYDSAVGDDGCFLHAPSPIVAGCGPAYPAFLERDARATSYPVEQLATDVACIGTLGTNGCGWEQQFKAARQALTTNARPGGCNEGFLRPDSIVVVLWMSDEDDASVRPDHPEMFDPDSRELGGLSFRAILHPELIEPVDGYADVLRGLRADRQEVLLGMIVGTPPDESVCAGRGDELTGCLAASQMQEQIDPANPTSLLPSCNTSMGLARPPRRFVELAEMWGHWSRVASICQPDWTAAMEGLRDMIAERVEGWLCAPELPFDAATCGVPACWAIETLADDGPCPEDPACPAARCPPLKLGDLVETDPTPCVDPETGATCQPLHRDLGTTFGRAGEPVRRCLLRQAARAPDPATGRCGEPLDDGWTWSPEAWGEHGCPEVDLALDPALWVPVGARVDLRCRPEG